MTAAEKTALRAHAEKCAKGPHEPYFWNSADGDLQTIVCTPEGWATVLALLDEVERLREALERISLHGALNEPTTMGVVVNMQGIASAALGDSA